MAVQFGCGCKVKSFSPEDGCFIAPSPACISFSTNTLAGRIYLLQIFCFQCGMHRVEDDFCLLCWKHFDSPSKQQREQIVLIILRLTVACT